MRYLMLIVLLVCLPGFSGCLAVKTGTTTTTYYDSTGMPTRTEAKEEAVGDGDTEYHRSVREVSKNKSSVVTAKVTGITGALAPVYGETKSEAVYRGILGALLVSQVDTSIAADIESIKKSKTGYDNMDTALGVLKTGVIATAATITVDKVTGALVDAVGNKINITGDGNSVETNETTTATEAHATTVGDNSPANTNLDQSQPVVFEPVDNDETETHGDEPEEEGDAGGEMPASCEGEGVYDAEKDRWYIEGSGGCSCESRADGSC